MTKLSYQLKIKHKKIKIHPLPYINDCKKLYIKLKMNNNCININRVFDSIFFLKFILIVI